MNNQFISFITRIPATLVVAIFVACSGSLEDRIEFSALNEDQRRRPENALAGMKVIEGLEVELFAAEPMVTNPTNISIDDHGRVWVCEAYNYDVSPEEEDREGDRIIVLEDTDSDGEADKRTVFYQGTDITTPLGIFVAGDTVFVSRSPNVLMFVDTTGDLVADRKDTLFTNLGNKGDHSAHSLLPGPDGMIYFSTGNYAGAIQDATGKPIVDRAGFTVDQNGKPYLGGMVMRFDRRGNQFEVLGHNFRNNYEPCVDSYGNIWQSDNDDDGNASCRINFVMPYGNYGYYDERTKEAWTASRVNMEEQIAERHWHQDDPGVVPNVLITGAGSPAGMALYEGYQLPQEFFGMPVHAEPYYNVVRAYLTSADGAGYTAKSKDILKSEDQWFRPVDVATAPDGSLFVADWYDPILGGGAAGDAKRGRIFRVSTDKDRYVVPAIDFTSVRGSMAALQNPNPETRFAAFHALLSFGEKAMTVLKEKWSSLKGVEKARALWLLAALDDNAEFVQEALHDKDPAIRATAVRYVLQNEDDVVPFLREMVDDTDPHVRRELLTALRYNHTKAGAKLWSQMAVKYDGKDRWYLEALGIAADLHADLYFDQFLNDVPLDLTSPAHRDIVWRSRAAKALPLLRDIIVNTHTIDSAERFFRAFDFHDGVEKNRVLSTLLELKRPDKTAYMILALRQLDPRHLVMDKTLRAALDEALAQTKGTSSFVDLVARFKLSNKSKELLEIATSRPGTDVASAAIDLLVQFRSFNQLSKTLSKNDSSTLSLLKSLSGKGNMKIVELIAEIVRAKGNPLRVRQQAVLTLGSSWPGEEQLLVLVKEPDFPGSLKPVAGSVLFNVYRNSIQREAAEYLSPPGTKGAQLPSVKELVASVGNRTNGEGVFAKLCTSCHRANGKGVKFGPELSDIGSKLSEDGLFRAIIYPDEGISHGFGASHLTLKDGSSALGIVINETSNELELTLPGGIVNRYEKSQVDKIVAAERSIMPGLAPAMTKQELVDLVEYLSGLRH